MEKQVTALKGRGSRINPVSRFEAINRGVRPVDPHSATKYRPVHARSLINKVDSPDIGFGFSLNPYQGCEHGCIYCYARNTHPYWGYSAGLDFERNILVKLDAPRLFEEHIRKPSWKAAPVMLSGNTDCYQPAEQKYVLTRRILQLCWKYRHPVSIITKNALILRDLDILKDLARHNLVHVAISVTTLDREVHQVLEPRTATPARRLETIRILTEAGVPVMVMMAPIIPAINDREILSVARAVARHGAQYFQHMVVRLNGDLPEIFEDWLDTWFPDRKQKVLAGIKSLHAGHLGSHVFRKRMKGEGDLAHLYAQQAALARRKFDMDRPLPILNTEIHAGYKTGQMDLFQAMDLGR